MILLNIMLIFYSLMKIILITERLNLQINLSVMNRISVLYVLLKTKFRVKKRKLFLLTMILSCQLGLKMVKLNLLINN